MTVTNFIWDELSDNVLLETDETDTLTARYTNRPEQFGKLLSQYRIEDEKVVERFYHYDGESSTSALTDSEENVTDTFIYTAYGEEVARTGTTTNPFGYKGAVGYYTNAETSDIYVRARSYEPAIGRWLSADPIGFIDGPNLYHAYFVPNGIDPSGKLTVIGLHDNLDAANCGVDVAIFWDFVLDKPAPCRGWMIQKITKCCNVQECDSCSLSPFSPLFPCANGGSFFEAFRVEEGRRYPEFRLDEDGNPYLPNQPRPDGKTFYTDKSGGYFDDNTCGFEYSIGEIRFYCEDSYHPAANFVGTGNLEQNWRQHAFMFGNGCNSVTGVNPANPTSESNGVHIWEFLPVEGPAHRSMTRVWNCCDNPCRDKTAVAFGFPRERG